MHGQRRGVHAIQHNTNDAKTGEKPGYTRSGLAFSTDVHSRNNRKGRYQASMNNTGMQRGRMRKEPANQSSGKATAKICCCIYITTGR